MKSEADSSNDISMPTNMSHDEKTNPPLEKAGEIAKEMKQEVEKYVDTAKEYWEDVSETVKEKAEVARKELLKARDQTDEYVYRNPWKAVGIAAALGALAALVLRSSLRCNHEKDCCRDK